MTNMKAFLFFLLPALFVPIYSVASDCPSDFLALLEGNEETRLYKKTIAERCIGRPTVVTGTVSDVDLRGDAYEVNMRSITERRLFEITMAKDPGADMLKIKKNDTITIEGKLESFGGYINRYVSLNEGVCIACE